MLNCRRGVESASAAAKLAIGVALLIVSAAATGFAREPEYELVSIPHIGGVSNITFSADGKFVLTGTVEFSDDYEVHSGDAVLWDFESGKPVRSFAGPSTIAAISPDAKFVVTRESIGERVAGSKSDDAAEAVIARDAVTGCTIGRFRLEGAGTRKVAISPDSKLVATQNGHATVIIWEVATGERRQSIHPGDSISQLAFSSDGTSLFTGGYCAKVWNVATGESQPSIIGGGGSIRAMSRDGKLAMNGSDEESATVWDVATAREVRRFETDKFYHLVERAVFAPDGKALLTTDDFRAVLWDVANGEVLRHFPALTEHIWDSEISPDGKFVLLSDAEGTVAIWDIATGVHKRNLMAHADGVSSVAFSADGQSILTGTNHGSALLWGSAADHKARVLEGHAGQVVNTAFRPDGRQLLTAAEDYWAIVWNASTGEKVRAFNDIVGYREKMAFSHDGESAVMTDRGHESIARLTSVMTGEIIQRFEKREQEPTSVAINRGGTQVLVGLQAGSVTLWDITSGMEIRNFDTGHEHVRVVAFSPDGKTAVTQSNDGSAMLWETQTGRRVHILQEFVRAEEPTPCQGFFGGSAGRSGTDDHTAAAAVAFSPDGKLVLAASDNSKVTVWETATGQKVRLLEGHAADVTSVACSPDGRFVVTGAKDGTARLWSLSTGRELARLMSFDAGRGWAVVTPDLLFDGSPNAVNYLAYRVRGTNRLATTAEMERCRRKELLSNLLLSE